MKKAIFIFLLIFGMQAQALDLSVWGEALYWKPTHPGVPFANVSLGQPNTALTTDTREFAIRPDFDWGWRAGVAYDLCDRDLRISGLRLNSSHSSSVRIEPISGVQLYLILDPAQTFAGNGVFSNRLSDQYWNIDLQMGQTFFPANNLGVRFSWGGRYVNLKRRARSVAIFTTFAGNGQLNLDYSGGGFETGIEIEWSYGRYLNFYSCLTGSALIGRTKTRLTSHSLFTTLFQLAPATVINPGFDFEVGISGSPVSWGIIRIGYAMHHYWNVFQDWTTIPAVRGFGTSKSIDAGFAGPYLTLGINF